MATANARSRGKAACAFAAQKSALADEADNVLCLLHRFLTDCARTIRAVGQDCIDMAWIGDQPFHLGGDRRQLGDAKVDQRVLENRELSAAEIAQHILLAASG